MSFKIEINNLATLQKMFRESPQVCDKYLQAGTKDAGALIMNEMQKQAPVKTARLKQSIAMEYKPISVRVFPNVNYAIFVHEGTKAHIIQPKEKKALFWNGALHPVRAVNHPAVKGNPFVDRTGEMVGDNVNLVFQSVLSKIINNI